MKKSEKFVSNINPIMILSLFAVINKCNLKHHQQTTSSSYINIATTKKRVPSRAKEIECREKFIIIPKLRVREREKKKLLSITRILINSMLSLTHSLSLSTRIFILIHIRPFSSSSHFLLPFFNIQGKQKKFLFASRCDKMLIILL